MEIVSFTISHNEIGSPTCIPTITPVTPTAPPPPYGLNITRTIYSALNTILGNITNDAATKALFEAQFSQEMTYFTG